MEELHATFPKLSYDVTIKVEHILKHRELIAVLRQTGCLFVTSAIESVDDGVLERLAKGHTRADVSQAIELMGAAGLPLSPTFVSFHPWTTPESYCDMLRYVLEHDWVDNVAPVQLAVRLLIPAGSRLLELPETQRLIGGFDEKALCYRWRYAKGDMTELAGRIEREVKTGGTRRQVFARIWEAAHGEPLPDYHLAARATIPYMTEPWFC